MPPGIVSAESRLVLRSTEIQAACFRFVVSVNTVFCIVVTAWWILCICLLFWYVSVFGGVYDFGCEYFLVLPLRCLFVFVKVIEVRIDGFGFDSAVQWYVVDMLFVVL